MTTREEQIEKAREIARLNPEWEFSAPILVHVSSGISADELLGRMIFESHVAGPYVSILNERWIAIDRDGVRVKTLDNRIRLFDSPAAAIRALGCVVKEEG